MPLKKSQGNMYPWVTHTHAHLGGECPHKCRYCYVNNPRFGRPPCFCGPLRILPASLDVKYGYGKTIFIDHMNDLWAEDVTDDLIMPVLDHCAEWPDNTFVYQSKNPNRFNEYLSQTLDNAFFGCTIETNREIPTAISSAPRPVARAMAMRQLACARTTFITIEPVMDFDVPVLGQWLIEIKPAFVNIGADSKGKGLPEPSADKIMALLLVLRGAGIEVREKHNLNRILAP